MNATRIDSVKVVEVIEVEFVRGAGESDSDPVRRAVAYFSMCGVLLGETDDWENERKVGLSDGS